MLLQELERFNRLLERMHSSIFDLKRALLGEIGMSIELDELANSLFNGFLPTMWSSLAPQTLKNLVKFNVWLEAAVEITENGYFVIRDTQINEY